MGDMPDAAALARTVPLMALDGGAGARKWDDNAHQFFVLSCCIGYASIIGLRQGLHGETRVLKPACYSPDQGPDGAAAVL